MANKIKFKIEEGQNYSIVSFKINGALFPEDLSSIKPPDVDGSKGVILSGRGPVWLYSFLTHFYHPTKFVATYDPRIGGAVIVETHSPEYHIGSILKYKQEDKNELD